MYFSQHVVALIVLVVVVVGVDFLKPLRRWTHYLLAICTVALNIGITGWTRA